MCSLRSPHKQKNWWNNLQLHMHILSLHKYHHIHKEDGNYLPWVFRNRSELCIHNNNAQTLEEWCLLLLPCSNRLSCLCFLRTQNLLNKHQLHYHLVQSICRHHHNTILHLSNLHESHKAHHHHLCPHNSIHRHLLQLQHEHLYQFKRGKSYLQYQLVPIPVIYQY